MPLALAAADTIAAKVDSGAGTDVNFFICGNDITTSDAYKLLAKGQIAAAAATIFTPGASHQGIVGHIRVYNSAAVPRIVTLYRNGTAAADVWATLALGPGEAAEWIDGEGWRLYDNNGAFKEAQNLINGFALKSTQKVLQGTVTYTPPAGVRALRIHCLGAGGGGGGGSSVAASAAVGGGGGGGAYSTLLITSGIKTSYTVAVGQGGTAGANTGGTGGTGGDTTFDNPSVCTAKGGVGGVGQVGSNTVASAAGGAGGAAGTGVGDITIDGNEGTAGFRLSGTQAVPGDGGNGAGPHGGGKVGTDANGAGVTGKQWGAGGSGALVQNASAASVGGVGANGILVVEEYF